MSAMISSRARKYPRIEKKCPGLVHLANGNGMNGNVSFGGNRIKPKRADEFASGEVQKQDSLSPLELPTDRPLLGEAQVSLSTIKKFTVARRRSLDLHSDDQLLV